MTASDKPVPSKSRAVLTHHPRGACSILRRSGWRAEGGAVQYWRDRYRSAAVPTMQPYIEFTHRCFLLSRAALPANSRISAAKYSRTAARYTTEVIMSARTFRLVMQLTRGTGTNALGIVSALEHTVDTTDRELEARFRGSRGTFRCIASIASLATRLSTLALARLHTLSSVSATKQTTHHMWLTITLVLKWITEVGCGNGCGWSSKANGYLVAGRGWAVPLWTRRLGSKQGQIHVMTVLCWLE